MARTTSKSSTSQSSTSNTVVAKPEDGAKTPIAGGPDATLASTAPEPKLVTVSTPVAAEADLKKKELIDLVVERSGIKKKDAKPVVEAMLAVLGETIAAGRELNLQPLGKLRINRAEEKSNGRIIVCKLRQSLANASTNPAPADDKE